jgi:hypothetical protein
MALGPGFQFFLPNIAVGRDGDGDSDGDGSAASLTA